MDELKNITVAFTGHRYYARQSDAQLMSTLRQLYAQGYSRFLCGMAWGFDLAAGEAVLELKAEHPEVELIAVVPHRGFFKLFSGKRFYAHDRAVNHYLNLSVFVVVECGNKVFLARLKLCGGGTCGVADVNNSLVVKLECPVVAVVACHVCSYPRKNRERIARARCFGTDGQRIELYFRLKNKAVF